MMGCGSGRWEVGPTDLLDVGLVRGGFSKMVGGWPQKQVGYGKLSLIGRIMTGISLN